MGVGLQAPLRRALPCFHKAPPNQETPLLDLMPTHLRPLVLRLEQHLEVLEQQVCD